MMSFLRLYRRNNTRTISETHRTNYYSHDIIKALRINIYIYNYKAKSKAVNIKITRKR